MINLSLRELQVFIELAETLNFRRAAARVHLSQSAVSGVIGRLEETLGARLFARSTRSVQLTDAGQALLAHARILRAQAETAASAVRDVVELREGRVRIAALPSLAATVVPPVFARFMARHPGVQLGVVDSLSGASFDLVRAGQVDFALTAENPAYADLAYETLASDPLVLLLPADHALAARRGPLRWAEVAGLPHISMPAPTSVRQYAEAALLSLGQRFAPRFEVEHLATINAMVAAGLGLSVLPALAAQVALGGPVVQRRLTAPDVERPIGQVMRQERSLSTAAAAVAAALRAELLHQLGRNAATPRAPARKKSPQAPRA